MGYNEYVRVVQRRVQGQDEQNLVEMYEYYFDGEEEDVWPMKDFFDPLFLSEEDRLNEIERLNNKGIHFDKNDSFVSLLYGSSNNRVELMDIDSLIQKVLDDEDDRFSLKEDLEDLL